MTLDRRWWIAIAVVAIAFVALVYSSLQKPPEECRPVLDLLEFNKQQNDLINAKSEGAEGPPTQAEEIAYQQWADGLSERARNIDTPELRFTAVEVADLAGQFVQKMPKARAETQSRAPGAPPPQVFYEMSALDTQIRRKLAELSEACKT
ncbi:hypothetical protein [Mycobacterium sp. 852002-51961_SCH5331710]|uniref:hypothetical protein n=1 Tax=Mycobacterium sp. 852002-51961_SCH5331710 TaxID=1834105 RepID=UPI0007FED8B4|nr:hypothetical protein [Mycobacterium sp. 852002-51961_SCH5331710]OBB36376.1 hypothetical protein A5752_17200 [Mycobacterium sp. 852002-51961_SCH5331710]